MFMGGCFGCVLLCFVVIEGGFGVSLGYAL